MKGLTLSEAYYDTVGKEMIAAQFGMYRNRIAAGLVGLGSECFGFDDELSRDHDWGPGFCLWLDQNDFNHIGASLQKAYDALPDRFLGFRRIKSDWGMGRVGVISIGGFYASFIGSPQAPESLNKWITIPEANLAACTNGKVFEDPLGDFSAIRRHIKAYYPEDVRLKKIAAKCMAAAQSGQYNFARSLQRKAFFPAMRALAAFCEDALSLVFLLHRQYMPFYKWACKAAETLPMPGPKIAKAVENLSHEDRSRSRVEVIEEICASIIEELLRQGLSDSKSDFLLEHGPSVHSRIQNRELKQLDMWWGGN